MINKTVTNGSIFNSLLKYCLGFLAFVLVAFNGRPYSLSSGFWCALVLPLLYLCSLSIKKSALKQSHQVNTFLLLSIFLFSIVSTALNFDIETSFNCCWGYFIPFLLYLSVIRIGFITEEEFNFILICLSWGVILRFGYGVFVFYSEWGLISMNELALAHFDLEKMESYMSVTFGSVGQTVSILTLLLPIFYGALFILKLKGGTRYLLWVAGVIILANMMIINSRASFVVSFFSFAYIFLRSGGKLRLLILGSLPFLVFFFITNLDSIYIEHLLSAVSDKQEQSVLARKESVASGINVLLDHPFGVGPGNSKDYVLYSVAHEFFVSQADEIGLLGSLSLVLIFVYNLYFVVKSRFFRHSSESPNELFLLALLPWCFLNIISNSPVNASANLNWIGLFVFCLSVGDLRFSKPRSIIR